MTVKNALSRRGFVGGAQTAVGYLTSKPGLGLLAQGVGPAHRLAAGAQQPLNGYDSYAKLSFNENPYGPPDSVMKAMTHAFKYANRYGHPDGGSVEENRTHHRRRPGNGNMRPRL